MPRGAVCGVWVDLDYLPLPYGPGKGASPGWRWSKRICCGGSRTIKWKEMDRSSRIGGDDSSTKIQVRCLWADAIATALWNHPSQG